VVSHRITASSPRHEDTIIAMNLLLYIANTTSSMGNSVLPLGESRCGQCKVKHLPVQTSGTLR
jgi:hypothetical protein